MLKIIKLDCEILINICVGLMGSKHVEENEKSVRYQFQLI